jgi:trigger factor
VLREKILSWLEAEGTIELVPEGTLATENDAEAEAAVAEADAPPETPEAGTATIEVAASEVVEEPAVEASAEADEQPVAEPAPKKTKSTKSKQAKS